MRPWPSCRSKLPATCWPRCWTCRARRFTRLVFGKRWVSRRKMRTSENKKIEAARRGHLGEALAALWLRLKGHRILGRRVKTRAGEIDLVSLPLFGPICFVDVKARNIGRDAAEAVAPAQRTRIARAASLYLASRPAL